MSAAYKIRERTMRCASPREGFRQEWTEFQVVGPKGRVLYRAGHQEEAERAAARLAKATGQ